MDERFRFVMTDGRKAIQVSDLPANAWTIVRGSADEGDLDKLYATVSWLYRAVEIRALAVSGMPFDVKRGDEVIYQYDGAAGEEPPPDDLAWLADLPALLQRTEAATVLGGRAYWEKRESLAQQLGVSNRLGPWGLAWMLPTSVWPKLASDGLSHFERRVAADAEPVRLEPEEVVYFWPPDPSVELGPAAKYPGRAVMRNAGVIGNMDVFLEDYFERGMVKATLLKYKDKISKEEGERVKEWWRRVFTGIKNAFATEVVRGDFEPLTIGEGVGDLGETPLTEQEREAIATGMGVPQSLMSKKPGGLGDSTDGDVIWFYRFTVIPEWNWMAPVLNRQLFWPLGLHLVPRPQRLTVMQEDEEQRSQAFRAYVGSGTDAGLTPKAAVAVLGVAIPDDIESPFKETPAVPVPLAAADESPAEDDPPEPDAQRALTPAERALYEEEAGRFLRWAKNRGWDVDVVDFETDVLTPAGKRALLKAKRPFTVSDEEQPVDVQPMAQVDPEDDVAQAVRAFRRWAEENEPELLTLLDSEVKETDDAQDIA